MNKYFWILPLLSFLIFIPALGENTAAYIEVGTALYEDGQYRDALAVYDKAIQFDDMNPILYEKKAECLLKLNQYREALDAINIAIALDESSETAKGLKDEITLKLELIQGSQAPNRDEQDNQESFSDELLDSATFENDAGNEKVTIQISEENIVRGTPFSTNIAGTPNAEYFIWTKGTGTMSGLLDDQPPIILEGQLNIRQDPNEGPFEIGEYQCQECKGKGIKQDVPDNPDYPGTAYYGLVKLDDKGLATVEWKTSKDTKAVPYTIHIERKSGDQYLSDDVKIQIKIGDIVTVTSRDIYNDDWTSNNKKPTVSGLPPPTGALN